MLSQRGSAALRLPQRPPSGFRRGLHVHCVAGPPAKPAAAQLAPAVVHNGFVAGWRELTGQDAAPAHPAVVVNTPCRDLRHAVAPGLEGGPLPLNTHGVAKSSPQPPFVSKVRCLPYSSQRQRDWRIAQRVFIVKVVL